MKLLLSALTLFVIVARSALKVNILNSNRSVHNIRLKTFHYSLLLRYLNMEEVEDFLTKLYRIAPKAMKLTVSF